MNAMVEISSQLEMIVDMRQDKWDFCRKLKIDKENLGLAGKFHISLCHSLSQYQTQ